MDCNEMAVGYNSPHVVNFNTVGPRWQNLFDKSL
jgi:hypothetical protein